MNNHTGAPAVVADAYLMGWISGGWVRGRVDTLSDRVPQTHSLLLALCPQPQGMEEKRKAAIERRGGGGGLTQSVKDMNSGEVSYSNIYKWCKRLHTVFCCC